MMSVRRGKPVLVYAASAVLLTAAQVFAAGEGGQHEGPNLFTGDLGNIFWSLVTFGAVLLVLGKFAWGPLLGALQKREDFIRNSLDQAKKDREDAEARLKEYEQRLQAGREEASALVEEGRRDAESVRQKIQQTAKTDADAMIDRAKREITIATQTAVKDLYSLTGKLATEVASRIIAKELDATEHERLIADSIEELQGVGGGRSVN